MFLSKLVIFEIIHLDAKSYKTYFLTSLFVMMKVSSTICCYFELQSVQGKWSGFLLGPSCCCSLYRNHNGRQGWKSDNCVPKKKYIYFVILPPPIQSFWIFPYSLCKTKESTVGLQT